MKIEIKNRITNGTIFTADIQCNEYTEDSVKLRFAIKEALRKGTNLYRANLSGANLSGAHLYRADLSETDNSWSNAEPCDAPEWKGDTQ